MDTVRDGLRANDLRKDTFDRLICATCDRSLRIRNNADELGTVRFCGECGIEWREMR